MYKLLLIISLAALAIFGVCALVSNNKKGYAEEDVNPIVQSEQDYGVRMGGSIYTDPSNYGVRHAAKIASADSVSVYVFGYLGHIIYFTNKGGLVVN